MIKFLFLLIGVIALSKTNGNITSSKSSLVGEENDEEFSGDDRSESDVAYPSESYGEIIRIPDKRRNQDGLIRRSALDKNFMRFGRSGFFPAERCCRQRDLIGFADDTNFARFTRAGKDKFIRFGKAGDDGFMRFGKDGADNFMRFGKAEKDKGNFMRFGRGDDNFMRFGRGGDDDNHNNNFMRFGRGGDDNFMRFGRGGDDNFMRFGRGGDDNFMRFGRGGDNFMRFGRGDKENFIRFGRGSDVIRVADENFAPSVKRDDLIGLIKTPINFARHQKSSDKDSFIRFGKRNGTSFLRLVTESGEDGESGYEAKNNPATRRKRMAADERSESISQDPETMTDGKRSPVEGNVTKPNLLKFISLINRNHPKWEENGVRSYLPVRENPEMYKRKRDGSGFIRFG